MSNTVLIEAHSVIYYIVLHWKCDMKAKIFKGNISPSVPETTCKIVCGYYVSLNNLHYKN